ncbi:MAG: M6 family metalloprotease domain-containing protein [Halobacteriota archaeon]
MKKQLIATLLVAVMTISVLTATVAVGQTPKASVDATLQHFPDSLDGRPHTTDHYLAQAFNAKLRTLSLQAQGKSVAEIAQTVQAPPPAMRGGLPATGTVQVPVFLVDFSDAPHKGDQKAADVQSKMFGNGDSKLKPYESLRNYYQRSSYGKLTITGKVFDWYRAAYPRAYYKSLGSEAGMEAIVKEVFTYWDARGVNFAPYDNDNNGNIDSFFVKWTGPDEGWSLDGLWWPYQTSFSDATFRIDGKGLNMYVWSWYTRVNAGEKTYHPQVDIHETGHLLGLPDYYDYECGVGPENGLGDLDMMDASWGDHNCFSKFLLGWITPTVVSAGTKTISLTPSETSQAAVLVMPGATTDSSYAEFFMAQYRQRGLGNDPASYPASGLLIWHVDARLNDLGTDFAYDNSYTTHKLIRLMEADGLEEIEHALCGQGHANAGDYYAPLKLLNALTVPNSDGYAGGPTGVEIKPLTAPGATMTAQFTA